MNVVNYDDSLPPIAEGNKKMTATFHSRMSMNKDMKIASSSSEEEESEYESEEASSQGYSEKGLVDPKI